MASIVGSHADWLACTAHVEPWPALPANPAQTGTSLRPRSLLPPSQALLIGVAAGAALCAAGHLGTLRLGGKAPLWTLGTEYPIGGCCGRCCACCGMLQLAATAGGRPQGRTPALPGNATAPCRLHACPPLAPTLAPLACLPPPAAPGAALVAVYGFGVAAMWISVFANEIVGLLQFFGMLRCGPLGCRFWLRPRGLCQPLHVLPPCLPLPGAAAAWTQRSFFTV